MDGDVKSESLEKILDIQLVLHAITMAWVRWLLRSLGQGHRQHNLRNMNPKWGSEWGVM